MTHLVGVVDYGAAGNVFSIARALEIAGAHVRVIKQPKDLQGIGKLVMPGVGSFVDGMRELNASGMAEAIVNFADEGHPLLGICLGMQVLSKIGFEYGVTSGLGLINGEVRQMLCNSVVPHMGFNNLAVVGESQLLKGITSQDLFYFMHSYEVQAYTNIISLSTYGGHQFVSGVQSENVFGLQFHPEKSRQVGVRVFENFLSV